LVTIIPIELIYGIIIGSGFGILGVLWLRNILSDSVLIASINIILVYFLFLFCFNYSYKASLITSVIVLGIILSLFGKIKIYIDMSNDFYSILNFIFLTLESILL